MAASKSDSEEFREYKRLILTQLQELGESHKTLTRQQSEHFTCLQGTIADLRVQVGELRGRAGAYGLAMGGIGTGLVTLLKWLWTQ